MLYPTTDIQIATIKRTLFKGEKKNEKSIVFASSICLTFFSGITFWMFQFRRDSDSIDA